MNRITLALTLAVLVTSMALVVMPIQQADATVLRKVSTGITKDLREGHYDEVNDHYYLIGGSAGDAWVFDVDGEDDSVIGAYNITQTTTLAPQDIWCGTLSCYVTFGRDVAAAGAGESVVDDEDGRIVQFGIDTTGYDGVIATYTNSEVSGGLYEISGRDSFTGGFGAVTLWVAACENPTGTNCGMGIRTFDGISLSRGTLLYTESTDRWPSDIAWSGISGTTNNHLLTSWTNDYHGSAANAEYFVTITNLSTLTEVCESSWSESGNTGYGYGVVPDYGNSKAYLGAGLTGGAFYTDVNLTTCAFGDATHTYSNTENALSAVGLRGAVLMEDRDVFAVTDSNISQKISFLNVTSSVLSTPTATYELLPSNTQVFYRGEPDYAEATGKLYMPYTGADHAFLVISLGNLGGVETSDPSCFDVDHDGITDGCLVDLDEDGVLDWNWNTTPIIGNNVGESIPAYLGSLTGFGVEGGALIAGVMVPVIGFMLFGMFTKKQSIAIPIWVYGIIFLAGIGISVILEWLEPWWIVIGILGFIAFGAKAIKGLIR